MSKLKLTLIKSVIGRPETQRKTVISLGLGKVGSSALVDGTPAIKGQVRKVQHLLKIEEAEQ
ncbi:50S ribosomal protein L30 [Chrysiogenes arsenatis]|uniref:50S ribosomal protein L30 n=1 Tax=Chrysiogenes arsenatis TaxID=309797 RepID=UPI0004043117|nr:50S ribosomal protein L30 [Chrysiogenes arsenatis]